MAKPLDISVIIPVSSENSRVPMVILDIDKKLSEMGYKSEIIVVASGGVKKTATILKNISQVAKKLKLLENDEDNGPGQAVRQGILLASGKIRLFTGVDNSVSISNLSKMMPHFKRGADAVFGSRAGGKAFFSLDWSPRSWRIQKTASLVLRPFIPESVSDPYCRFKAFTAETAEKIFTPLKSSSPMRFHVEILKKAKNLGCRVVEIPVEASAFRLNL